MIFFEVDFLNFLADLEVNNNRDWFNTNKNRFKTKVEAPFQTFIGRMIDLLQKEDARNKMIPNESYFRIYKYVRLSKDKSPYKTHMSALISAFGKKEISAPGLYLEFRADSFHIYSGIYEPGPEILHKIRTHIATHLNEFKMFYLSKSFIERFGEIRGEKNKVLSKEFKAVAAIEPLLYNKAFYYTCAFDSELILKDGLEKLILKVYKDAKPLNEFLENSLV